MINEVLYEQLKEKAFNKFKEETLNVIENKSIKTYSKFNFDTYLSNYIPYIKSDKKEEEKEKETSYQIINNLKLKSCRLIDNEKNNEFSLIINSFDDLNKIGSYYIGKAQIDYHNNTIKYTYSYEDLNYINNEKEKKSNKSYIFTLYALIYILFLSLEIILYNYFNISSVIVIFTFVLFNIFIIYYPFKIKSNKEIIKIINKNIINKLKLCLYDCSIQPDLSIINYVLYMTHTKTPNIIKIDKSKLMNLIKYFENTENIKDIICYNDKEYGLKYELPIELGKELEKVKDFGYLDNINHYLDTDECIFRLYDINLKDLNKMYDFLVDFRKEIAFFFLLGTLILIIFGLLLYYNII